MNIRPTFFRSALLGSALATLALSAAVAANQSRADLERVRAATGASTMQQERGAASGSGMRPAAGSTYAVLHNFAGGTTDGTYSTAEVTLDKSGNIYGVTESGGANGYGVLFELAPDGTETLLHSFGGTGDGTTPDGGVTIDSSGDIYGTTNYGGASNNGTLWELAADGTYGVLHSFASNEGNFIRGRLVRDKKGNFYGTALFGGTPGYGTVFEYSSAGTLTVLHAFDSTDGEYPEHGVVMDKHGNLFGVTAFGGSGGQGTVYEIAKDGTFSTLYNFTGGASDGGFLYGTVAVDKKGNIYGSTDEGGASGYGTVFKVTSSGNLTTLYNFTGSADGGNPEGDMLLSGKGLYSMATSGGSAGLGAIYKVTIKGKETVLESLSAADGDGYSAGLTKSGSTFYGTTSSGGTNGDGVVFSLKK